jgi:hypothetical protein
MFNIGLLMKISKSVASVNPCYIASVTHNNVSSNEHDSDCKANNMAFYSNVNKVDNKFAEGKE